MEDVEVVPHRNLFTMGSDPIVFDAWMCRVEGLNSSMGAGSMG